ncbi:MAG: ATP-dependent Clp protease adaptor ClpS [Phocaeicola sp.]|nr:ATP-dependent Clp protease adaptor ClpS [Phocaeicola sp.]
MEKQQTSYKEKEKIDLKEPRRYKVIIHNDDFTTMEFVVKVLVTVFFKSESEAESLMMGVHKTGSAVVGVYSYDIAMSKVRKATDMARAESFPLKLTISPEEQDN